MDPGYPPWFAEDRRKAENGAMLLIAIVLVLIVAPLAYALIGVRRAGESSSGPAYPPTWPWRASAASLLAYVIAFDLTFFVQELFLVLPKAFTPGLRPTLFHNNHAWEGDHPLASLFQGTGALATLLLGIASALWLRRAGNAPTWWRLLLFWFAFSGVYMALPQVVLGALLPQGDVGMAMAYFQLGAAAKSAIALLALAAMPIFALWLLPPLLATASDPAQVSTPGARMRYVLRTATLPALCAIPFIALFRMPREWIEVLLVPLVITVAGLVWLQLGAWRFANAGASGDGRWPLAALSIAALLLLALFQLVLRPGIAFYSTS